MGFFSSLFGKKGIDSILVNTQNNIFKICGITKPTDAQKMRASFYIFISGMAILNNLEKEMQKRNINTGEKVWQAIDKLMDETEKLTEPLSMRVGELSNNKEELEEIIASFPKQLQLDASARVNGLAAFRALYATKCEKMMTDMLSREPSNLPRYAAIVVTDGIFGEEIAENHIDIPHFDISIEILSFREKLLEII